MSLPVSSPVTPPGSPPSPTMSMGSINDQSQRLDMALQLSMRKIRVMIVDDNCINLAILSRMLTVHFAESVQLTAVMTSGVAALQTLGKEEVDLILMDIDMPVLTGVETAAAIRENRPEYPILAQNQKVPIIAVTTSDGCAQRQLYLQVGMSDCVSKPIALPRLRKAINSAIWPCGRWSC
ncbi:sensitivity to red-light reduced protein [Dissophora globulifera]|uniref:Sensitivity to red-light reduced protein n=1 Tax=Dissophora globulifera TaxID=979702 RepID=A0A9P6RT90_9FUNG|nr:sensitivity to red-light reduced protein [Dissophora globulifera]